MSGLAKEHHIEVRIGAKNPKLFLVPKQKVTGIESLLAEYEVDDKKMIPADKVFAALDKKYSKVGNILAGFRLRDNLTQAELAKEVGTSQPVIAAIENGSRKVGKSLAYKLATVFKTNFQVFVG